MNPGIHPFSSRIATKQIALNKFDLGPVYVQMVVSQLGAVATVKASLVVRELKVWEKVNGIYPE